MLLRHGRTYAREGKNQAMWCRRYLFLSLPIHLPMNVRADVTRWRTLLTRWSHWGQDVNNSWASGSEKKKKTFLNVDTWREIQWRYNAKKPLLFPPRKFQQEDEKAFEIKYATATCSRSSSVIAFECRYQKHKCWGKKKKQSSFHVVSHHPIRTHFLYKSFPPS